MFNKLTTLLGFDTVEKTAEDLFDSEKGLLVKAGSFINDLHLSDAEKLQNSKEIADATAEFTKLTMGENTRRSKTRRKIALLWIRVELMIVVASAISYPFDKEYSQFLLELASISIMTYGTCAVLAFFFGGYYLKGADLAGKFSKIKHRLKKAEENAVG